MNVTQFIEAAREQGRLDSRGDFSLTLPRLLEKIAHHAHQQSGLGPPALVAAGVGSQAQGLNITEEKESTVYRFEVKPPDLHSFESLWQSLAGQRFLWAMGVQRAEVQQISLHGGKRRLVLTADDHAFESAADEGLLTVVRVRGGPAVQPVLLRHCTLCPVPIKLNGGTLQTPLDQAHRGREVWWSGRVPSPLRPEGKANLRSDLGVVLYPAKTPLWVAVVGGLSYPFTLKTPGMSGVVWCEELKVDLGLRSLVLDDTWKSLRNHLLELCGATA